MDERQRSVRRRYVGTREEVVDGKNKLTVKKNYKPTNKIKTIVDDNGFLL